MANIQQGACRSINYISCRCLLAIIENEIIQSNPIKQELLFDELDDYIKQLKELVSNEEFKMLEREKYNIIMRAYIRNLLKL